MVATRCFAFARSITLKLTVDVCLLVFRVRLSVCVRGCRDGAHTLQGQRRYIRPFYSEQLHSRPLGPAADCLER
jgi:hypothetical protein